MLRIIRPIQTMPSYTPSIKIKVIELVNSNATEEGRAAKRMVQFIKLSKPDSLDILPHETKKGTTLWMIPFGGP